jgi:hypothetical protein
MPYFDEMGWLIFWAGIFLSGGTLLFFALYCRFTSQDDTDSTERLNGSELAVSQRHSRPRR